MPTPKIRLAVLVTGSRRWEDDDLIRRRLRKLGDGYETCVLIHGDAGGADTLARNIARSYLGWEVIPMSAQWRQGGKEQGPQRNQHMVDVLCALRSCGYDVRCEAFQKIGSAGTSDCVRRAIAAGVPVHVTWEE